MQAPKTEKTPILTQVAEQQIELARNQIKDFAKEAKTNPGLVKRLKENPERTLLAAGVPQYAVGDFLREEGMQAEVSGLAKASCWISCACSPCCISG